MSAKGDETPSFLDGLTPAPRPTLSDAEADRVHALGEEFYVEYGKLVARFIDRAPSALAADRVLEKIGELSNPYSSCWDEHAKVFRPLTAEETIQEAQARQSPTGGRKRGGR